MDCPRWYFYLYVLGWDSMHPRPYLVFGEGMHAALEVLLQKGLTTDAGIAAYDAYLKVFNREYQVTGMGDIPEETSGIYSPGHAFATIGEYIALYEKEEMEVLHTELGGSALIDLGDADRPMRKIYFRMDGIIRRKDGIWCMEHKTSKKASNNRTWIGKWDLSFQIGTYSHVGHLLYPGQSQGVEINGILLATATKNDVAAGRETGNEYLRLPQRRSMDMLNAWLWNANQWYGQIETDFERLMSDCDESDPVMCAFPMNTQACTKYWGCPYRAFCGAWANPLRRADAPPMGFGLKRWNPQERAEQAKQFMVIGEPNDGKE